MVKIAIIDSGYDFGYTLSNQIVYNIDLTNEDSYYDYNGHGTCVTRLVDSIGSNMELCNIKVLNQQKRGNLSNLKKAISIALDKEVDVINLSLGYESAVNDDELNRLFMECNNKNIIMIIANSNSNTKNLLTVRNNIIRVQGNRNIKNEKIIFENGTFNIGNSPRILPWLNKTYILSGANSFITPYMIKEVVELIQQKELDRKSILPILETKFNYYSHNIIKKQKVHRAQIFDQSFYLLLMSELKVTELYDCCNKLVFSNITTFKITVLVKIIEKIIGHSLPINSIWIDDMLYLENLSNKIIKIIGRV